MKYRLKKRERKTIESWLVEWIFNVTRKPGFNDLVQRKKYDDYLSDIKTYIQSFVEIKKKLYKNKKQK